MQYKHNASIDEHIQINEKAQSLEAFTSCIQYLVEEAKELEMEQVSNALEVTLYVLQKSKEEKASNLM